MDTGQGMGVSAVLAIDTSTEVGVVCLTVDGRVVAEIGARVRARQGEVLMPHVVRVLELGGLAPADLDLLVVGLGPGSFTGLRIGVATAKGLAVATGKPLVGVSSLAAIASGVAGATTVVTALEAHKGEIYAAAYGLAGGVPVEVVAPLSAELPAVVAALEQGLGRAGADASVAVVGEGADRLLAAIGADWAFRASQIADAPRGAQVARLGVLAHGRSGPADRARLEPIYVRSSDAVLPSRPLHLGD